MNFRMLTAFVRDGIVGLSDIILHKHYSCVHDQRSGKR